MTPQEMLQELYDDGQDWDDIGISRRTFFRILNGGKPSARTAEKIRRAYHLEDGWE